MSYREISGETVVTFKSSGGLVPDAESVFGFDVSHTLASNKLVHRDYNYEKTPLKLKGKADSQADLAFEIYDYPGKFQTPEKGEQLASIRYHLQREGRRGKQLSASGFWGHFRHGQGEAG